MPTYLYIDEFRADTSQRVYRSGYDLRHANYKLNRKVTHKGEITSQVAGGRIRVVIDVSVGDTDIENHWNGFNKWEATL